MGRSLGTLHIGVCCGAGLRIRLLGLGRRLSDLRRGGCLVGRVCLGRIAAGGFLLFQIGGHIKGAAGARLRRGRRLAGHGRQAAGQVFNGDHIDELAQLLVDLFENRAVSGRDDRHLRKTRVFGLVDGQA